MPPTVQVDPISTHATKSLPTRGKPCPKPIPAMPWASWGAAVTFPRKAASCRHPPLPRRVIKEGPSPLLRDPHSPLQHMASKVSHL